MVVHGGAGVVVSSGPLPVTPQFAVTTEGADAMGFEIFEALDADWALVAPSAAAREACRRWQREHALRGCTTPADVLYRTRRGVDPGDADRVLAALARRAPHDAMAARTLLQSLVPGMVSLARRHGAPHDPEVAADVVGIALERIRTYPYERRPRAIAANVLLDTHQRLYRDRRRRPRPVEEFVVDLPAVEEPEAAQEVIEVVRAALRQRAIAPEDARLVLAPVVGEHDEVGEAGDAGIKPRSVARRRQRATRRLVEFARGELGA